MVGSLNLFGGGNEVRLFPDRLVQNIVFQRRHIAHVNKATHAICSRVSDTPVAISVMEDVVPMVTIEAFGLMVRDN